MTATEQPTGSAADFLPPRLSLTALKKAAAVTNAVKHFKWEKRTGTERRIHRTPTAREIRACHPWLKAELAVVKPQVVLCLGATAAQSLMGKTFRVTKRRGEAIDAGFAEALFATVHPSAVLRAPSGRRRDEEQAFFRDVSAVGRWLARH